MKNKALSLALIIALIIVYAMPSFATMGVKNDVAKTFEQGEAKYVFYFIGDGLGAAQRQLAELYKQGNETSKEKLLINSLPSSAINTTHANDTLITDSAAAGTALATGRKTNNGYISVDAENKHLKTLAELAKEDGKAVGIATTTRVTHATPAVFISHNVSRNEENAIAVDIIDSGVDYLVGGGIRHFIPQDFKAAQTDAVGAIIKSKRKDDRNLLKEFARQGYIVNYGKEGATAFTSYTPKANDKYVNLFTYTHCPYTIDDKNDDSYEVPTIAQMTKKGIELLSKNEDGFFFMIEGGRIDHACHPNDPAGTIQDTLAFDDAVKEAYEFYKLHSDETLIVVVGDHETGGLGLGVNTDYFMNLDRLTSATMSIENFMYSDYAYNGDRVAYLKNVEKVYGMKDFTNEELAILNKGMDMVDAGILDPGNYYEYDEAAEAVIHVFSERAGVYWTSYAHTGTQIPMSAVGVGAGHYNGFIDNTDIAKITAILMGTSLE